MSHTEHVCNFNSTWPVGHPLPVEDPAKLEGPELGAIMVLPGKSFGKHKVDGEWVPMPKTPDRTVRVTARSYVWSPGECRSNGGRRYYDWSVVEDINDPSYHVCVNDTDLNAPVGAGEDVEAFRG